MTDRYQLSTALHDCVCKNENISLGIVSKLLDVGGRELVMNEEYDGCTALHSACKNKNLSVEVVSKLLKVGGRELLVVTD